MFSKLIIEFEGDSVVFELHELVKVAQLVMGEVIDDLEKLQEKADTMSADNVDPTTEELEAMLAEYEASIVDTPPYQDYAAQLLQRVDQAIRGLAERYENQFGINQQFRFEAYGESLTSPLSFLLELLYKTNMSYFLMSGGWQAFSTLLDFLKLQNKPELLDADYGLDVLLPPHISQIDTVRKWLHVARYVKQGCGTEVVKAWWLNIAGRLILLENLPHDKEHLYVSDQGTLDESLQRANQHMISFSDQGITDLVHAVSFWKFYNEKLTDEDRVLLKEQFILLREKGFGGSDDANVVLLQCLGLPRSVRPRAIQTGRVKSVGFGSIGMKDRDSDPWVGPVDEQQIAAVDEFKYAQFEREYINALEANRYLGEVLARPFIESMFKEGQGPFFTQLDNAFHPGDAEKLKRLVTLRKVAENAGRGLREFMFRPGCAFASRDKGESYRGFTVAFQQYFSQGDHLTESAIAQAMRAILRGEVLEDQALYFLPNLVAAWFVSEVARNEVSILSNLMLLDLIESGVQLIDSDGNNLYSWHHVLIHPKKPAHTKDKAPINDMYGDEIDLGWFDGMHPMAHRDSAKHSRSKLGEKQKLSAVRQKEGHLIIHWLFERLKKTHPGLTIHLVDDQLSKEATSYKLLDKLLKAKNGPSNKIKKNKAEHKKWRVLYEIIIPLLRERAANLDHLLQPSNASQLDLTSVLSAESDKGSANDIPQDVLDESRKLAEKGKKIGSRHIPGWVLQDVEDRGNCFYDAVAHQMQGLGLQHLLEVPEGTLPRDVLRLRVQGEQFRDKEYADAPEIQKLACELNLVVGIVDTRDPTCRFVYHYINNEGLPDSTPDISSLHPQRPVVRVAFTGNHYLSVVQTADESFQVMLRGSQIAQSSSTFFGRLHEEFLIEHRHDDARSQRAYDQRYGIVPL